MQDFIDMYKETYQIDDEIKLDESLSDRDIEITDNGYKLNASKDADILEMLGTIKLHTIIKDERVFKPTTDFMQIIVLAWIYKTMSIQLEVLEMDLLLEKLLIKKEHDPYSSYAVLKILEANPTLTGADASSMDHYLSLEPNSIVLDQIESNKVEIN
ncbi:hypothetical protein GCM10012288_20760 [Malaciobacter pacificus]|uniref:Uncharacterized protein n=1 Tax=Malaciobacter pacificus TaxID=1080223 RepID=A0A5C2HB17_9BACT|nr:hypothetical protein [Malaciobacter pacificus]QEP34715.1 hypothetical protein APAC_1619 [Malaciobacter pacificus]GGD46346.1 hypothetical protein GCM10012288_20760 [Malaciobacter pacificus]